MLLQFAKVPIVDVHRRDGVNAVFIIRAVDRRATVFCGTGRPAATVAHAEWELESVRVRQPGHRSSGRRRLCPYLQGGGRPLATPSSSPPAARNLVRGSLSGRLAGRTAVVSRKHSPASPGPRRPIAVGRAAGATEEGGAGGGRRSPRR